MLPRRTQQTGRACACAASAEPGERAVRDGRRPGSRASARPGQPGRPGLTSDTKSVRRRESRSPGAPANRRLAPAGHAPRALARKVEPAGPGKPAAGF